jgi:hypothetical protein
LLASKLAGFAISAVDDEDSPDEKDAGSEEIDGGDGRRCGSNSSIVCQAIEIAARNRGVCSNDCSGDCEEEERAIWDGHQLELKLEIKYSPMILWDTHHKIKLARADPRCSIAVD